MAVKMITAEELRAVLGADAALQGRVNSIHAAACVKAKTYAVHAPIEIRNEAVILLAGWLWQSSAQRRSVFPEDGLPVNVSRAFLLSGAQGLLSSWRRPRAGRVDEMAVAVRTGRASKLVNRPSDHGARTECERGRVASGACDRGARIGRDVVRVGVVGVRGLWAGERDTRVHCRLAGERGGEPDPIGPSGLRRRRVTRGRAHAFACRSLGRTRRGASVKLGLPLLAGRAKRFRMGNPARGGSAPSPLAGRPREAVVGVSVRCSVRPIPAVLRGG